MVLVQLQKHVPGCSPRVYDVGVEPGAAARCATPRDALRRASPDIWGHPGSRCGSSIGSRGPRPKAAWDEVVAAFESQTPRTPAVASRASPDFCSARGPSALDGSMVSRASPELAGSGSSSRGTTPRILSSRASPDQVSGRSSHGGGGLGASLPKAGGAPAPAAPMSARPSSRCTTPGTSELAAATATTKKASSPPLLALAGALKASTAPQDHAKHKVSTVSNPMETSMVSTALGSSLDTLTGGSTKASVFLDVDPLPEPPARGLSSEFGDGSPVSHSPSTGSGSKDTPGARRAAYGKRRSRQGRRTCVLLDIEEVTKATSSYVQFGRGGLRTPKNISPGFRVRGEVYHMGQLLLQSMTTTFESEVWDACEVAHPSQEREKEQQALLEARETAKQKEIEKHRHLSMRNTGRDESKGQDAREDKLRQAIPYQAEREADAETLHQEKIMAWLAKQVDWSVLDIEEVADIFRKHAVDGFVSVTWQAFAALLKDIFTTIRNEDVKLLLKDVKHVQRYFHRTPVRGVSHWRDTLPKGLDLKQDFGLPTAHAPIKFPEFCVALVRWIDGHHHKVSGGKCLLTRYKNKTLGSKFKMHSETIKNKMTSASDFKKNMYSQVVLSAAKRSAAGGFDGDGGENPDLEGKMEHTISERDSLGEDVVAKRSSTQSVETLLAKSLLPSPSIQVVLVKTKGDEDEEAGADEEHEELAHEMGEGDGNEDGEEEAREYDSLGDSSMSDLSLEGDEKLGSPVTAQMDNVFK